MVQRSQSKDRSSLVGIRDRKMLSYFWFSVHETAGIESTSGDHESRSGEIEKNLWLLLCRISPSCRRRVRIWPSDSDSLTFLQTPKLTLINPFDWLYRRDGEVIRHCTFGGKEEKEFVCKIVPFSVYARSRFASVRHGFCFRQCLRRNLTSVTFSRRIFQRSLTELQSTAIYREFSNSCFGPIL